MGSVIKEHYGLNRRNITSISLRGPLWLETTPSLLNLRERWKVAPLYVGINNNPIKKLYPNKLCMKHLQRSRPWTKPLISLHSSVPTPTLGLGNSQIVDPWSGFASSSKLSEWFDFTLIQIPSRQMSFYLDNKKAHDRNTAEDFKGIQYDGTICNHK